MKRIDDKIQMESRDEIRELMRALEAVPEEARNETAKKLLNHLSYMEWMW